MSKTQPSLQDLQQALTQIAQVKQLALEAGLQPKPNENDADFVLRIRSEIKDLTAADAPKQSKMKWAAKKAVKVALLAALGLPTPFL